MKKYTRVELMQICKDAVVPCSKWDDRDSYCAQMEISTIYGLLAVGAQFTIDKSTDERTIHISFKNLTKIQRQTCHRHDLQIDSRDEYHKQCDPEYESEMFDGYGIDATSSYLSGYMPTRKRLEEVDGDDWY